jgi:hypothetical protein
MDIQLNTRSRNVRHRTAEEKTAGEGGGTHRAAVAQGMASGRSLILASSRQLRKVGELEEHQGACTDPWGSSVEDGRQRSGLSPVSSRSWQQWHWQGVCTGKEMEEANDAVEFL